MEPQYPSAKIDSKLVTEHDANQSGQQTSMDAAAETVEVRTEEVTGIPPAPVLVPEPVDRSVPVSVPVAPLTQTPPQAGPVSSLPAVPTAGLSTPMESERTETESGSSADGGQAELPQSTASHPVGEPSNSLPAPSADGSPHSTLPTLADPGQLRQLLTDLNTNQQQVVELMTALLDQNRAQRDALGQLAAQVAQLGAQNSHALAIQTGG